MPSLRNLLRAVTQHTVVVPTQDRAIGPTRWGVTMIYGAHW